MEFDGIPHEHWLHSFCVQQQQQALTDCVCFQQQWREATQRNCTQLITSLTNYPDMLATFVRRPSLLRPTHAQSPVQVFRRQCATKSQPTAHPSSTKIPSLAQTLATGYVTLLGANFISNMMIHPTQKVDYGVLNYLYPDGREVGISHTLHLLIFIGTLQLLSIH